MTSSCLKTHVLKPTTVAKYLGITLLNNLRPGLHCTAIARKACTRANLIIRSFLLQDAKNYTCAFSVYVRPIVEYCTPVWNPCSKCDLDTIENVQCTFTCRVFSICHLPPAPCNKRLAYLGLRRLKLRCLYTDLILMYKIIFQSIHSNFYHVIYFASKTGVNTRGHCYKLIIKSTCKRVLSSCLTNCLTHVWNFLPNAYF